MSSVHPWTDNRIYFRECESLAEEGYEVLLVATESNVDVAQGKTSVITLPRRGRVARLLRTVPQSLMLAFRSGARVIHIHDPELFLAVPIGRILGRYVIYDAHEDLPAQVINKPYIRNAMRPLSRWLAHMIVGVAKFADWNIAATESIAKRFDSRRTSIVHNYPPLRDEEMHTGLRDDAAVYIGGMSAIRGTRPLLQTVTTDVFPSGWRLQIAGSFSSDVAHAVEHAQADNRIVFHGQIPPDAARDLLLTAKVGIVPFQDTIAHRDSLPTKLFEYLAAGLPVIVSDFPLWRRIVEDRDCGLIVDETSPAAIAKAIAAYAEDPELWLRHSRNARLAATTELNWGSESKTLLSAYRNLIGAPGGSR